MFPEGRVVGRERRPAGAFILPGGRDEDSEVFLVEEQVVTVDQCFPPLERESLARLQFKLASGIGSQNIPLVEPEGSVMDAQITRGFIKRRYGMRRVENDFEHMIFG
jgi:hypothetical protein